MSRRSAVGFVLAIGVWTGSGVSRAASTVTLRGWEGEGRVMRGHGMGPDLIVLVAEADWVRSAPRDPARYSIRAHLPGGRVVTRDFPATSPPPRSRFEVYLPADAFRNLPPSAASATVEVVDSASGSPVGNPLAVTIADLPRPRGDASAIDPGPFGRGRPLDGDHRLLPESGPDGFRFARVGGVFLATTEATVRQVGDRLKGYDPKLGRSDEFALEAPDQPAVALTPARALEYLTALGLADPVGVGFRLPTRDEWRQAALGGKSSAFWWGDQLTYPAGANLLGPEPALAVDATAPSLPPSAPPTFEANPFGLYHTFGNVAEWATDPAVGFVRMGGHFRTEPASPLPELAVAKPDEIGPDAFVGVRPAFTVSPEAGVALARERLEPDKRLANVRVGYEPDRALITLSGPVVDSTARRAADKLLEGLWFASAVENRLESPAPAPGQLATVGGRAGPGRKVASLGRTFIEVPVSVRWLDPLPVSGSDWWLNVYLPDGGHVAQKLAEGDPGRVGKVVVAIDRATLAAAGLADDSAFTVALSLGAPAPSPGDPRLVSNPATIRPTFAPTTRGKSS